VTSKGIYRENTNTLNKNTWFRTRITITEKQQRAVNAYEMIRMRAASVSLLNVY